MRDFVKKRDVQMRAEKLSQVIEEAIALTRASVRDGGPRLTVETGPPGAGVEIDKIQGNKFCSTCYGTQSKPCRTSQSACLWLPLA